MAEAVLVGVATEAAKALAQLVSARAIDEMKLVWCLADLLKKLKLKFSDIQAFLEDVGSKKQADERRQVTAWLQNVIDAAYVADDIMDEYDFEILRRKVEKKNSFMSFFTKKNPLVFRVIMARKVSHILATFDELDKKAQAIGLKQVGMTRNDLSSASYDDEAILNLNQTRQLADANDDEFIGREEDEEKLVEMLCDSTIERDLTTIAIVGLGGLGKTTFARHLYKSEEITNHFDKRLWVSVPENFFAIEKILKEILEQETTTEKGNGTSAEATIKKLQPVLKMKKYFLVLDDVWCTNGELWGLLKTALQRIGGSPGSVILVTTRLNEVASQARAEYTHFLPGLTDDESWELFKKKAFVSSGSSSTMINSQLEEIGRNILNKCHGVPLAVKAIGSLLQSTQSVEEWKSIEESDLWDLPQNDKNQILPSLRLTFNHLPSPSLKQCFAYCAVFPKDSNLEKDELVDIWVAQGFLHVPEKRNLNMEEIAEDYIKVLLSYSLLQELDDEETNTDVPSYKIHDLVHDLAVNVSGQDVLFWKQGGDERIDSCRHLVIQPDDVSKIAQLDLPKTLKKLRTISGGLPAELLSHAKYLRTLSLDDRGLEEVPVEIGLLKHLRYLSLSFNPIKTLPDSIGKLYQLQTLRLVGCKSIQRLPAVLRNLVNLRHLPTHHPMSASRGLLQLTNLQTLPHLTLSHNNDNDEGWSIDELGSLNKLRGKIQIHGLENVKSKDEATKARLHEKAKVSELTLGWSEERGAKSDDDSYDEEVLDGLRPHSNITSLELQNFFGLSFPSWMMRMAVTNGGNGSNQTQLNNLTTVKLTKCSRCPTLPTLGQLPLLKYLIMSELAVEFIDEDFYTRKDVYSRQQSSFPSLVELEITGCPALKGWNLPTSTTVTTVFPLLGVLRIKNCSELETLPTLDFESLKEIEIENLDIRSFDIISSGLSSPGRAQVKLEKLEIRDCKELTSLPSGIEHLKSLKLLVVWNCPALTSISDDLFTGLSSLSELCISGCGGLTRIPTSLQGCSSLEILTIEKCPSIEDSFPDLTMMESLQVLCNTGNNLKMMISMLIVAQNLPNLEMLGIGGFEDEDDYEHYFSDENTLPRLQSMKLLSELILVGQPKTKSLPEQLQLLTGLQALKICKFEDLEELPEWIGDISSLEQLWLDGCKNLKYMPSKGAMLKLTRLWTLYIDDCPLLAERCSKDDDGPEWNKISHVKNIEIDEKVIQDLP